MELAAKSTVLEDERSLLAASVRSAGNSKDLDRGRQIHARIIHTPHAHSRFLANLLIEMYGKCGSVEDAESIYARIRDPNIFTNNIMIASYARNGQIDRAKALFDRMGRRDSVSWTEMITAYAHSAQIDRAKEVFDEIPDPCPVSWNALIAAYTSIGQMESAIDLFQQMPNKDLVSWNSIITGFARIRQIDRARCIFKRMPRRNIVSWNALITAYTQAGDLAEAKNLFDRMPQRNSTSWNILIAAYAHRGLAIPATKILDSIPSLTAESWRTIISAYCQRGDLDRARSILDSLSQPDLISSNALLAGYGAQGNLQASLTLLHQMPVRNLATWTNLVLSYINGGDLAGARNAFNQIPKHNNTTFAFTPLLIAFAQRGHIADAEHVLHQMRPFPDTAALNAMIAAYTLHGRMLDARRIFDAMSAPDTVSWTSIVSAYASRPEALTLFARMDLEGAAIDKIALVVAADACGDLAHAKILHAEAHALGLDRDLQVGTALVIMYGRCGSLSAAAAIFEEMPKRDSRCWNAMLAAHAQLGHAAHAVDLVYLMSIDGGATVDEVTILCLLSSCSHGGLFQAGCEFFRSATADYFVSRTPDHFGCMIDLLGRAGWLELARELLESMPFEPDVAAWTSLLASGVMHYASRTR